MNDFFIVLDVVVRADSEEEAEAFITDLFSSSPNPEIGEPSIQEVSQLTFVEVEDLS